MKKNLAVIGSSGAIGNAVSKILLDDASIESVYNFSRSNPTNFSDKSKNIYIDIESEDSIKDAVKKIPTDKILLETDVPYLAPEPFKGKRNKPTYIKHTGAKLAELLGLTPHDLSKVTIANTNKVLNRET